MAKSFRSMAMLFFLEQREDGARGVAGGENEPLAAELFVAGENDITGVDFEV